MQLFYVETLLEWLCESWFLAVGSLCLSTLFESLWQRCSLTKFELNLVNYRTSLSFEKFVLLFAANVSKCAPRLFLLDLNVEPRFEYPSFSSSARRKCFFEVRNGTLYGCSTYPDCNFAMNLDGSSTPRRRVGKTKYRRLPKGQRISHEFGKDLGWLETVCYLLNKGCNTIIILSACKVQLILLTTQWKPIDMNIYDKQSPVILRSQGQRFPGHVSGESLSV
jgi:ssDNA-binding Zn-finger/Zn-ribbon topoisomerase 1